MSSVIHIEQIPMTPEFIIKLISHAVHTNKNALYPRQTAVQTPDGDLALSAIDPFIFTKAATKTEPSCRYEYTVLCLTKEDDTTGNGLHQKAYVADDEGNANEIAIEDYRQEERSIDDKMTDEYYAFFHIVKYVKKNYKESIIKLSFTDIKVLFQRFTKYKANSLGICKGPHVVFLYKLLQTYYPSLMEKEIENTDLIEKVLMAQSRYVKSYKDLEELAVRKDDKIYRYFKVKVGSQTTLTFQEADEYGRVLKTCQVNMNDIYDLYMHTRSELALQKLQCLIR